MNYELKHIHGVPYFLDGTTVRIFALQGGQPSDQCIAIGTYHPDTGDIESYPDWEERIQPCLAAFRAGLVSYARGDRESINKPQKQRKAARNPRKSSSRAKNPASDGVGS